MAERAAAAGYKISHTQLGAYAAGRVKAVPDERTRKAIAAALFGNAEKPAVDEVTAAALQSVTPGTADGAQAQHALAFMRLTEGRTEEEIRKTLAVVEVVLGIPPRQEPAGGAPESSVEGPSRE
ncbi:MAG TPA: hypothetical protein VHK64_06215 [Nocardioidaceae bacterium]|jgi:hypothetical protein|nr:hypothetical protein [Nocardioidaceae bacterium]